MNIDKTKVIAENQVTFVSRQGFEGQHALTNRNGFTLIELMIAIAIFSIGFMAIGGLQVNSLNRVTQSQETTLALAALEDVVEVLKQTPLYEDDYIDNNGVDNDGDGDAVFDLSPAFREQGTEPDFTVSSGQFDVHYWLGAPLTIKNRWTVSAVTNLPVSKRVRVSVSRSGESPVNALSSLQFVKYWASDN